MRYGYARVSGSSQDYQAQVEALKAAGCGKLYSEKKSAKNTDRPEFMRRMKAIKPGDTIVVVRLDRLVRSSRDLANVMHDLTEMEWVRFPPGNMVRHYEQGRPPRDDHHGRY